MSMRRAISCGALMALLVTPGWAGDWPLIYPDGRGLPPGQGTASEGTVLYQKFCSRCHGREGLGGTAPELIGGEGPLSAPDADKTIKTYWPFATTLFDTIRRGMPPENPGVLSDNDIYALTAFILAKNGLWAPELPLTSERLSSVQMPNRRGFQRLVP